MSKGKVFVPFVIDANTKQQVLAKIVKMTKEDAAKTTSEPAWQTDWDSEYISNPRLETYALKIADTDELIGLAAYLIEQNYMAVQIILYGKPSRKQSYHCQEKKVRRHWKNSYCVWN